MRFLKREMRAQLPEMHSPPTACPKAPVKCRKGQMLISDKYAFVCIVFHKVVNTCGKLCAVEKKTPKKTVTSRSFGKKREDVICVFHSGCEKGV